MPLIFRTRVRAGTTTWPYALMLLAVFASPAFAKDPVLRPVPDWVGGMKALAASAIGKDWELQFWDREGIDSDATGAALDRPGPSWRTDQAAIDIESSFNATGRDFQGTSRVDLMVRATKSKERDFVSYWPVGAAEDYESTTQPPSQSLIVGDRFVYSVTAIAQEPGVANRNFVGIAYEIPPLIRFTLEYFLGGVPSGPSLGEMSWSSEFRSENGVQRETSRAKGPSGQNFLVVAIDGLVVSCRREGALGKLESETVIGYRRFGQASFVSDIVRHDRRGDKMAVQMVLTKRLSARVGEPTVALLHPGRAQDLTPRGDVFRSDGRTEWPEWVRDLIDVRGFAGAPESETSAMNSSLPIGSAIVALGGVVCFTLFRRRRRRRRASMALLGSVCVLGGAIGCDGSGGVSVAVDRVDPRAPTIIDLGTCVPTAETLRRSVPFTYTGTASLTIDRVVPGCACLRASVSPGVLETGCLATLTASLTTLGKSGVARIPLDVIGKCGAIAKFEILLNITPRLSAWPKLLALDVPRGGSSTGVIELVGTTDWAPAHVAAPDWIEVAYQGHGAYLIKALAREASLDETRVGSVEISIRRADGEIESSVASVRMRVLSQIEMPSDVLALQADRGHTELRLRPGAKGTSTLARVQKVPRGIEANVTQPDGGSTVRLDVRRLPGGPVMGAVSVILWGYPCDVPFTAETR